MTEAGHLARRRRNTMEDRLGVETVRGALASLVTDPPKGPADYRTFRDRLERAGASVKELQDFEKACPSPRRIRN